MSFWGLDEAEEADDSDNEADEDDGVASAPAPTRPTLKTKSKKSVGHKSALTDEFWEELKGLYEGSGYSPNATW